jgi:hypothetical protein
MFIVVKFAILSEDLIDEERRQLVSKGVKFDVGEGT